MAKRRVLDPGQRGLALRFAPAQVACLWLPRFEIRVELERHPELAGRPVVLVGRRDDRAQPMVQALSAEAQSAGLEVSEPAQNVSKRCPAAVMLPYDAAAYRERFAALLAALDAITPLIEPQPLDAYYLDLSGFEGLDAEHPEAVAELVQGVLPERFQARVGVGSGRFTSWVAAHLASPNRPQGIPRDLRQLLLDDAPASLLPGDAETHRRLDLCGLRTLGKVAKLPRSAMLAQFGWHGERLHRLASGEDGEPLRPHVPLVVLEETLEFGDDPVTVSQQFDLAVRLLTERVCRHQERRNRAVRQVRLSAELVGDAWERVVTLRQPTEDHAQIAAELVRRLEPVRPAGAITRLALELTALAGYVQAQPRLLAHRAEHRADRLAYELEQLRERLGYQPVCKIVPVEEWSRLPERRYALLSCDV